MYQRAKDLHGNIKQDFIIRIADNAWIPANNDNRDWVEYQAWLQVGNIPLDAD